MKMILPALILIIPPAIIYLHLNKFGESWLVYFIPRPLSGKGHSKQTLRQAGCGFIFLSLWMFGLITSFGLFFEPHSFDNNPWILGLIMFAIPLLMVIFFIIGLYYLSLGIFSRTNSIAPSFQSSYYVEQEQLEYYAHKLKTHTYLNIIFVVTGLLSLTLNIIYEKQVGENLIPLNVACLIGFILTANRQGLYKTKCLKVMDIKTRRFPLISILLPLAFIIEWRDSLRLAESALEFYNRNRLKIATSKPEWDTIKKP